MFSSSRGFNSSRGVVRPISQVASTRQEAIKNARQNNLVEQDVETPS